MNSPLPFEERRMADYLLGRLPEEERQQLAEQLLANDEHYRAILATEEALIDRYATDELDDAEARLVEARLLNNAQGREKLRTARAFEFRRHQAEPRRRRRRWLAAAAILVAAGGLGVGVFPLGWPPAITSQPPRTTPVIASFVLSLNVYRGEPATPAIHLPEGAGLIDFAAPLAAADRAAVYEVRLRTPDRGELTLPARESTDAGRLFLHFHLDRAALTAGRYEAEIAAGAGDSRRLIASGPIVLR
jgi:hypothetical protein